MKEKLINYFKTFSNKDINGLSEMFSDDIRLSDWDIMEFGKKNVLTANQKIFDSVETITVKPINFYFDDDNTASVEILVVINEIQILEVVDIISFNENGLIDSIKAYKK
jgi:acetylglutamate kinase